MEELVIFLILLEKKKENEKRLENRKILQNLRDNQDPFSVNESVFRRFYSLPKSLCRDLIADLKQHDSGPSVIPMEVRFLSVLYFYSHGSKQSQVCDNHFTAMSQPSMSRCINYISKLIVQVKHSEIAFPDSTKDYDSNKAGFKSCFGMKDVIGAIGSSHIAIIAPSKSESDDYINKIGYHSINVEAICDHALQFLHVNAKFPGSADEVEIWETSSVRAKLMREHRAGDRKFLLADSNHEPEPWLLTPLTDPANSAETRYNEMHSKARSTIEKAFSSLKSRFKCLSGEKPLRYAHKPVAFIVYACAILHNILQKHNLLLHDENHSQTSRMQSESEEESNFYTEGVKIRNAYISKIL